MVYGANLGRYVAAVLIVAAVGVRAGAGEAAAESVAGLRAAYERLDGEYRRELEHLAHVAFARGWSELGEAARGWRPAQPESGALVFVAPDQYAAGEVQAAVVTEGSSEDARPWADQFAALRKQQAEALFELATRAADVGQLSLALEWATEAVREDPDHADARRVLGYEKQGDRWLTTYGVRMAEAGRAWHPRFGWVAPADVPRYEGGERLVDGRWLRAETEALRRRDINRGWTVRTDRFLVTTNHSLESAAELAGRLERLHQVWRQLFAGFYLTEREVRQLFAGERNPRTQARPFRVFYHRDREEYAAALRRLQPRVAETLGIYFDTRREAHFFAGEEQHAGTLYHEAVHQLFQESRSAARQVGVAANFWIVEGVATYFETLSEHIDPAAGRYYTVGESTAGRLPAARERVLEGFYVPLAELSRLGKDEFQRHPQAGRLYSQVAGLAAFLIDGQEGRYREPLVDYLTAVYAGRDNEQSLSQAAGVSYHELDAQYHSHLESLP